MAKKFAFFYFMKNEPEKIGPVVPEHIAYWKNLNLDAYTGGPFDDRSGGLITFQAENLDEAIDRVGNDPFISNDLLTDQWIKAWMVD